MLYFRELGSGEPLVILHGLYGCSDNWLTIARQLKDYRLIIPDLRNHGRSPHFTSHTYSEMVEDVKELLEHLQIDNARFLGHSMGGKLAMLYSLRYPQQVSQLVVADISPRNYANPYNYGLEHSPHAEIIRQLQSVNLEQHSQRASVDKFLQESIPETNLRSFLLKNLSRIEGKLQWKINLDTLGNYLPEIMDGFTGIEHSSQVSALFIQAEYSSYITNNDLYYIKKHFPQAQVSTLQGCNHWLHTQRPKAFLKMIKHFLL